MASGTTRKPSSSRTNRTGNNNNKNNNNKSASSLEQQSSLVNSSTPLGQSVRRKTTTTTTAATTTASGTTKTRRHTTGGGTTTTTTTIQTNPDSLSKRPLTSRLKHPPRASTGSMTVDDEAYPGGIVQPVALAPQPRSHSPTRRSMNASRDRLEQQQELQRQQETMTRLVQQRQALAKQQLKETLAQQRQQRLQRRKQQQQAESNENSTSSLTPSLTKSITKKKIVPKSKTASYESLSSSNLSPSPPRKSKASSCSSSAVPETLDPTVFESDSSGSFRNGRGASNATLTPPLHLDGAFVDRLLLPDHAESTLNLLITQKLALAEHAATRDELSQTTNICKYIVMVMSTPQHLRNATIQAKCLRLMASLTFRHYELNIVNFLQAGAATMVVAAMTKFATSRRDVQWYGVGALRNFLVCPHQVTASLTATEMIVQAGGVEVILAVMQDWVDDAELQEQGCGCIVNLLRTTSSIDTIIRKRLLLKGGAAVLAQAQLQYMGSGLRVEKLANEALELLYTRNSAGASSGALMNGKA